MLPHGYGAHTVQPMKIRARKFVGTVVLVVFLIAYAFFVMGLAATQIVGSSGFVEVLFFLVAGLAWVIPAGLLVKWMQRPD